MEDEEDEMKEGGGILISWEQSYYKGGSVINIIKQTIDNVIIMPNNNCLSNKKFLKVYLTFYRVLFIQYLPYILYSIIYTVLFIQYYSQSMRKRRKNFKSICVFASFIKSVSGSGSESVKI